MKASRSSFYAVAIALLAVTAAAQPSPGPEPSAVHSDAKAGSHPSSPVLNVDFPGGTIAQLIASFSKSGNPPLNIVGEKADLETPLPAFSVRNADPSALAASLNVLLGEHDLYLMQTGTIFTLTKAKRSYPSSETASFQIAPCLQFQSVDDIVDAIRTAWQLDPSHKADALQLKYHPATTLLLAAGPPEAVDLAGRVISSLKGSPPRPEPPRANAGPPPGASPPKPPPTPERQHP